MALLVEFSIVGAGAPQERKVGCTCEPVGAKKNFARAKFAEYVNPRLRFFTKNDF